LTATTLVTPLMVSEPARCSVMVWVAEATPAKSVR
jgi:hypothetical protein